MNDETTKRRILLGVTGGIAAYKSPELVRRLRERGADVSVVLSRAAMQFVAPQTCQAVSGRRVRTDLWDAEAEAAMGHIELARWADAIVVAPSTANFIGKLAHGLADDLLTTICIASDAPVFVAPAMNHVMWKSATVQDNCDKLRERGVRLLGPATGDQACGEYGEGRMLEPEAIAAALIGGTGASETGPLAGLKAVVTAGPTREPIDPVRYITNRSSGKMGFAIAAAASEAGADVVLISGPVTLATPAGVQRIDVETAEEMFNAADEQVQGADIFIACAAVADYRPKVTAESKIKRQSAEIEMSLVRSPDTLASVAARCDAPFTVGFAAETCDVEKNALIKLERKGLDMIAANRVGPDCGFDQETNQLSVYWQGGEAQLDECAKPVLARRLIDIIAARYFETRTAETPTRKRR